MVNFDKGDGLVAASARIKELTSYGWVVTGSIASIFPACAVAVPA
jgi:hypothetical protein